MRDKPCKRCFAKWHPDETKFNGHEVGEVWVAGEPFERLLFAGRRPDFESVCEDLPSNAWSPEICWHDSRGKGPYMRFMDGSWQCPSCGMLDDEIENLSTERFLARSAEKIFFSPTLTPAIGNFKSAHGNVQIVKIDFVATALDLAKAVWGVLGCQHWAAQWARIFCVDVLVSQLQVNPSFFSAEQGMLLSYLLGVLNALWKWILSLDLVHDPSCFLRARVTAVLNIAKAKHNIMDDVGNARLLELENRWNSCTKQAEILPMKHMLLEDSISFN